jgi:hypothetical protein
MANRKTRSWTVAMVHGLVYALPFLLFNPSMLAFYAIWWSHALIDRYRLARFVVWAKNFIAPLADEELNTDRGAGVEGGWKWARWWYPWAECAGTGYHKDRPAFLAVWLLIIADNTLHLICNGLALKYLSQ